MSLTAREELELIALLEYEAKDGIRALNWRPQKRQMDFMTAAGFGKVWTGGPLEPPQASFIGYGGAAGGGKSDSGIALCGAACILIPGIQCGYFRRTFPMLDGADGAIARSRDIFKDVRGATYNQGTHRWTFPNGSMLHFCTCQWEEDVINYQSTEFGLIVVDEATHFTWEILGGANGLMSRNRCRVEWPGLGQAHPFMAFPTNPGNIGHGWYRQLFVDSGNHDEVHEAQLPSGAASSVVFLPARLEDNPIFEAIDPGYRARLESMDEIAKRQLLYGDWDIAAGLFFSQHWRAVPMADKASHIIDPFPIPAFWKMYGSVDYGFMARNSSEKPFVYQLYAADTDGRIYLIDEVAGAQMDVRDQIAAIQELESRYSQRVQYRCGCPAMFIKREAGGPTIAEQYAVNNLAVIQSKTDHVNGWARCLEWLRDAPDKLPWFQAFRSCQHFCKQIASIPSHPHRTDDIDPNCEDHAVEPWRHFLMSRPGRSQTPVTKADKWTAKAIIEELTMQPYQG